MQWYKDDNYTTWKKIHRSTDSNRNTSGEKVYIQRIVMSPTESAWPFVLKRRQYPTSVCFAMTINKSQGQSLNKVGLYLPKQVFTHGQLYVAFSRVTQREGRQVMVDDEDSNQDDVVKNIVYTEIF